MNSNNYLDKLLAPLIRARNIPAGSTVDCIGLALDLEARLGTVESQTTERVMRAAANGLRLLAKEAR